LTGEALTMTTLGYATLKDGGHRLVGDPVFQVVWVRPYTKDLGDGTIVALETCEEMRGALWSLDPHATVEPGVYYLTSNEYFFRYNDQHRLVIFVLQGENVESCPT